MNELFRILRIEADTELQGEVLKIWNVEVEPEEEGK